jgi:hypothetical protein
MNAFKEKPNKESGSTGDEDGLMILLKMSILSGYHSELKEVMVECI